MNELFDSWNPASELDESDFAPPAGDHSASLLPKLPPGPFRSLGGYFNYEGWPDQQRFIELDESLRRQARENARSCKSEP